MAFPARYADGRAAITRNVQCEIEADGVALHDGGAPLRWAYADLRRADDGNGRIVLRRKQDRGERLTLEGAEPVAALRAAAPQLFRPTAQGVEGRALVGGLTSAAATLAAVFLVGLPMAAEPVARALPASYQDQISEIAWSQVEALTNLCDDSDEAALILNDLATRLMETADVPDKGEVWVTIVDAPFPNAFALPDNSIVVTDDLIALAGHPDELAGVISHEIGHIAHRHVMANILRNIGAGVFFDVVFGGAGAGQAIAVASVNLASLRFSRGDESEADSSGFDYLDHANINPGALATFFGRIAELEREMGAGDIPTLLASHPASTERAAAARRRARPSGEPALNAAEWRVVRSSCGMDPDARPEDAHRQPETPTPAGEPATDPAKPVEQPADAPKP